MVAVVISRLWIHVVTALVRRAMTSNVVAPMAFGVVAAPVVRSAAGRMVAAVVTPVAAMTAVVSGIGNPWQQRGAQAKC